MQIASRRVASLFVLAFAAGSAFATEPEFSPYRTRLIKESPLRSGPGGEFYATQHLPAGTEVEVYRRSDDGYLGIRPPDGGFSWVPARYVRATGQPAVGELIRDGVAAWVGSSLGRVAQHHSQVKLHKGERVEILDRHKAVGDDKEPWYRIAPPAGEFRWIHESRVARKPDGTHPRREQVRIIERTPARPASSGPRPRESVAGDLALTMSPEFTSRLNELSAELSSIVSRKVDTWDFQLLKHRTTRLMQSGATPLERGKARLLLENVQQFESLQQRRQSLEAKPPSTTDNGTAEPAADTGPNYDGQGWLVPVRERTGTRDAPPYALVDEDNRVVHFISPAPGLNLHRYLRERVGIYGQRGYIPTLKKSHIQATRVVKLARHE